MKLKAFKNAFLEGEIVDTTGLHARILRGKCDEDFLTMSDDPDRRLVMFMGSDGLAKMSGKSTYDRLVSIGYKYNYINLLLINVRK